MKRHIRTHTHVPQLAFRLQTIKKSSLLKVRLYPGRKTQNSLLRLSSVMYRRVVHRGGSDLDPRGYRWRNESGRSVRRSVFVFSARSSAGTPLMSQTSRRSDPARISRAQGTLMSSRRDCQRNVKINIF